MPRYTQGQVEIVVDAALREDLINGDATTDALIPDETECSARLIAQQAGVLAGIDVARRTFSRVDSTLQWSEVGMADGDLTERGAVLAEVRGNATSIMRAERTALNFMQRMSGIATLTATYVEAVASTSAIITDTRKTAPGLRVLDKYAVMLGGGRNHRSSLSDGVLIKDNHLQILRSGRGLKLQQIVKRMRERAPHTLKIEIEVNTVEMAVEASQAEADIVLLDNMSTEDMWRVVELIGGVVTIEASGGITLANVLEVAKTGVDIISVGELTHSSRALDISLEIGSPQ